MALRWCWRWCFVYSAIARGSVETAAAEQQSLQKTLLVFVLNDAPRALHIALLCFPEKIWRNPLAPRTRRHKIRGGGLGYGPRQPVEEFAPSNASTRQNLEPRHSWCHKWSLSSNFLNQGVAALGLPQS